MSSPREKTDADKSDIFLRSPRRKRSKKNEFIFSAFNPDLRRASTSTMSRSSREATAYSESKEQTSSPALRQVRTILTILSLPSSTSIGCVEGLSCKVKDPAMVKMDWMKNEHISLAVQRNVDLAGKLPQSFFGIRETLR